MTAMDSLRRHARFLCAGIVSFVIILGMYRWSSGDPLVNPASDFGVLLGFAIVAAFLVWNDLRGMNGAQNLNRTHGGAPE